MGSWYVVAFSLVSDRFLYRVGYRPHPQRRSHRAGHVRLGSEAQSHGVRMVNHPRFHEWVTIFIPHHLALRSITYTG